MNVGGLLCNACLLIGRPGFILKQDEIPNSFQRDDGNLSADGMQFKNLAVFLQLKNTSHLPSLVVENSSQFEGYKKMTFNGEFFDSNELMLHFLIARHKKPIQWI